MINNCRLILLIYLRIKKRIPKTRDSNELKINVEKFFFKINE